MIRGNVSDVFAVLFFDGQEIHLMAKDAEKAYLLAENIYPSRRITKVSKISNDDYDN